jgi:MFS family permease
MGISASAGATRASAPTARRTAANNTRTVAARTPKLSVVQALRQPSFRWLAVAFSLNSLASIAIYTHLISYFHDRGYEATLAASVSGLVGAMQVVGRIILGALGDRVPLRVNAAVVLGLQPLAFLSVLFVPGVPGIVAFVILFGASRGAVTLVRPAFVADIYGRERYGTIAGALAGFVMTATALAPIGAGLAYDLFGGYDPLFWSFSALSALAAGVVLLVRSEAGSSAADAQEPGSAGTEHPPVPATPPGGPPGLVVVEGGRPGNAG